METSGGVLEVPRFRIVELKGRTVDRKFKVTNNQKIIPFLNNRFSLTKKPFVVA